jgi:tetratricopeptide (TPR) repeat protein
MLVTNETKSIKMKRSLILYLACAYVVFFVSGHAFSAQKIIIDEDQFRFAQNLMKRGSYAQAIGEFERFIHFFPENEKVPLAHYLVGICHMRSGRYEVARQILNQVARSEAQRDLVGAALFAIGESYYQEGIAEEALRYFQEVIEKHPDSELKNAALYRLGWVRMRQDQWQNASQAFGNVGMSSRYYESAQYLVDESLQGEMLPYKNPTDAGTLAAILPGLGHAYVGRYKDGLLAFVVNGLFIWAAIESFRQDHEVLGGILLFLEVGWYTGNIYSAVNVAHKYNRKTKSDFMNGLKDALDLDRIAQGEGHFGFALGWRF